MGKCLSLAQPLLMLARCWHPPAICWLAEWLMLLREEPAGFPWLPISPLVNPTSSKATATTCGRLSSRLARPLLPK